ncbi:PREDICTED: uncharacterized protein LOC101385770 [Odobenus rosmarus divergens]|uniref:Uncharacterized protein LOC101385770 n=1 Tax=Odobenus rosmarus divergens TaxID=9708 RepID=A0A9B0LHL7_ODORO
MRGPPGLARAGSGDLLWAGDPDGALAKCAETCLNLRVKKIVCGLGEATLGLETPRQIFLPTWVGGAERSATLRPRRSVPRAERAARPRPLQRARLAGPPGDSFPVGFAEVETSLKWLCACKLQFQPGTPPLVLLTSPLTSAQFTLTPRNPRFCTELCRGSEYTTDYKEHSSGFSQGPSFPFL